MILQVNTHMGNYPIIIKRNALSRADEYLKLAGRRVCIVTDTGVPAYYATTIADLCDHPVLFRFPEGESSKTMDTLQDLLRLLLRHGFDRADAIVAVGGGVVTDLAGFAAALAVLAIAGSKLAMIAEVHQGKHAFGGTEDYIAAASAVTAIGAARHNIFFAMECNAAIAAVACLRSDTDYINKKCH